MIEVRNEEGQLSDAADGGLSAELTHVPHDTSSNPYDPIVPVHSAATANCAVARTGLGTYSATGTPLLGGVRE